MEMPEEQFKRIEGFVKQMNEAATEADNSTCLSLTIGEVYDRVLLYLNTDSLDPRLERIVARIVSGIFNQTLNSRSSTTPDVAINSVSDNGQSVSFSKEVRNYLATAKDNELFSGFTELLAKYRRINVVP